MDARQKKLAGQVTGGCGCLLLFALTAWLGFVVYVGVEGRGNDEEVSMVLGAITCVCMLPVFLLTGAGLYFGLIRKADPSGPGM